MTQLPCGKLLTLTVIWMFKMNLLAQFNAIFNSEERAFAKITGVKPDGMLIATTPTGVVVLLQGKADIGKNVFYDRVTSKVLEEAPNVTFIEYGV